MTKKKTSNELEKNVKTLKETGVTSIVLKAIEQETQELNEFYANMEKDNKEDNKKLDNLLKNIVDHGKEKRLDDETVNKRIEENEKLGAVDKYTENLKLAGEVKKQKDQDLIDLVDRIENLNEEKLAISESLKDIYKQARFQGYNPRAIKKLIAERKIKDPIRVQDQQDLFLYQDVLGMENIETK